MTERGGSAPRHGAVASRRREAPARGALPLAVGLLLLGVPTSCGGFAPVARDGVGLQHLVSPGTSVQRIDTLAVARLQALLEGRDSVGILTDAQRAELKQLYRGKDGPLWIDATGHLTENATDAMALISRAADEGLNPADYHGDVLRALVPRPSTTSRIASELADFDVALSSGLLRYLRHLHMGRVDPRAIGFRLNAPSDRHDFPEILRTAMDRHQITEVAAGLRPPLAQYGHLRAMLRQYRALADDPAWSVPPASIAAVHAGDLYAASGILYRQLKAFGDLPSEMAEPTDLTRYESALVQGVKQFQVRHGLVPDGVLGKATLAALRVPIGWRVRQIELALERLRWLPHVGEARLIALNIPMFRFWAWDVIPPNGEPLFGMNAIVGRALRTQTPVFVENMREVIFRPYWNVPRSILLHELLPRLERDPDYLRREDMEIVRGESDGAQAVPLTSDSLASLRQGRLRLRQRPGPKNALGLIKFVFPNEEDVYMHGTPAQALFTRSRRDFSHGCVRVEDPVALAEWVLQDRPEWTKDRILATIGGTQTLHVKLTRPIQVILFYTTAAVMPEDGTIWFAEDIYRHDARLDRALTARRSEE